jgi:phosphoglycerate kinase
MAKLRTVNSATDISGKTALLRIDSDVDIENGAIIDDTRLSACMPTVKFLLAKGAEINIIGHLGRPNKKDEHFTLTPVARWFKSKLKGELVPTAIGKFSGWKITDEVNLVENLRFFDEEEKNDESFSRDLALLGDIYVNEAFAVSHRDHASILGVTKFLPSYAGLHMQKEVETLSQVLVGPKRPLTVLIGGAKIETKLPLVEKMHRIADYVLVGGELAEQTGILIKVQHERIPGRKSMVLVADLLPSGLDITPKSVENFKQVLQGAATIVWNGPVGLIRSKERRGNNSEDTERGTRELAEFIVATKAYKVVGGGDTLSYLRELGLLNKFDFVSTGGGAMLEFLSGKNLPGILPLMVKD